MTTFVIIALALAVVVVFMAIGKKEETSIPTTGGGPITDPIGNDPQLPKDEIVQELAPEATPAHEVLLAMVEKAEAKEIEDLKKMAAKNTKTKKAPAKKAPTKKAPKKKDA